MAERLALPTSDHGVAGSNPAEGEILPEPKRRFTAQSLSCSPFHCIEMTEKLLKGRKTLTHPISNFSKNIFPGCSENPSQSLILGIIKPDFLRNFALFWWIHRNDPKFWADRPGQTV